MTQLKRYKYGYIADEWGMNRYLGLIEDPNGAVCKFDDVQAAQAQALHTKPVSDAEFAEWCKPTDGAAVEPKGCLRCNTPKKCSIYGCSPGTWESEKAVVEPVKDVQIVDAPLEPVAWLHPTESYSVVTTHQKETNEFQYSDEFLAGHTVPLYTSPPNHTKAMRLALEALIDAFYQLNTFPRSEEHQRVMTDCDAAIAALEESLKCQ